MQVIIGASRANLTQSKSMTGRDIYTCIYIIIYPLDLLAPGWARAMWKRKAASLTARPMMPCITLVIMYMMQFKIWLCLHITQQQQQQKFFWSNSPSKEELRKRDIEVGIVHSKILHNHPQSEHQMNRAQYVQEILSKVGRNIWNDSTCCSLKCLTLQTKNMKIHT